MIDCAMFVISIAALKHNARILCGVADDAGCRIVLALKGFACWKAFPYIRNELDGCCASGLWEAMLARDHFGKHIITYSPAYDDADIDELCGFSDHLDFNSLTQWRRFRDRVMAHPRFVSGALQCGLRINPECSTGATPLYDPCVAGSRLGITADMIEESDLIGISGLHFHTLCEQGADALETTLEAVERKFGQLLRRPQITYLNMGGGHWITKPDYDRERLVRLVKQAKASYGVDVWLEPGEAAAIHTGVLRARVMDVFESSGHRLAILDVSATAHMPDVLEMPYRPQVHLVCADGDPAGDQAKATCDPSVCFVGERYPLAGLAGDTPFTYRLGGPTCLAGDVIGDYAFARPLVPGDVLVFDDMAHYTMVKTTTFNGVKHPPIALQHEDGRLELLREFTYADFRDRLS
jgi:carboxynorspermidine decarboxylase